jgi:hypothetical protein
MKLKKIILVCSLLAVLNPLQGFTKSKDPFGVFMRKEAMNKLNKESYAKLIFDLNEYWIEKTGADIAGDFKLFSKVMDIGKINTALEVGEKLYAGDYKKAIGVAELAVLSAYVPIAGPVLLAGKGLDAWINSLSADIFAANTKKIYKDVFKTQPVYFEEEGVDLFYNYIHKSGKGKLKVRAWFYEYAKSVNNSLPSGWHIPSNREKTRTQVRTVVNTLRRDMISLREMEKKKEELKKQKKILREQLNALKRFNRFLDSKATRNWILGKVKEMDKSQKLIDEVPLMIASMEESFNQFMKYYRYFMQLVNSGQAVEMTRRGLEVDGGPGCTCPTYIIERGLSGKASYSLSQAASIKSKFRSYESDWRVMLRKLTQLAEDKENLKVKVSTKDLAEALESANKTNEFYFTSGNRVEILYAEMQTKLNELDIGRKDSTINADTMPDGLDPLFVPNVMNLDSVPATQSSE